MLLIRDLMYLKPGKVRPMVEKQTKDVEDALRGYHELVDHGRREIDTIEEGA